jgi:hypothetical protein
MRTVALDEPARRPTWPTWGDQVDDVQRESVADVVAFLPSPLARNASGQGWVLAWGPVLGRGGVG